jgi:hypothetical protein
MVVTNAHLKDIVFSKLFTDIDGDDEQPDAPPPAGPPDEPGEPETPEPPVHTGFYRGRLHNLLCSLAVR